MSEIHEQSAIFDTNGWYQSVSERFHCEHEDIQPTKQENAAGVLVVVLQCQRCGKYVRQAKKAEYDVESLPWFDKGLMEQWGHAMSQAYEEARNAYFEAIECKKDEESAHWWRRYNNYLQSEQWRRLRAAVLLRDQYLCQGCLIHRATQVHHTTYKMYNAIGQSMAFELVSVCDRCHHRIHPDM